MNIILIGPCIIRQPEEFRAHLEANWKKNPDFFKRVESSCLIPLLKFILDNDCKFVVQSLLF
jgi:hypothetical protein